MNGCETQSVKKCTKCLMEKSVEDFHRNKRDKSGRQAACKVCAKKRQQEPKTVEIRKRSAWLACLRKFGITEDQYNEMFERQSGLCAICLKPELDVKLAVDHCHETGTVRGLLCKRCNMAIGLLYDNPDSIARALLYIKGKR